MRYFFKHWERIKKQLGESYIMLFLDFDGTLTPIMETPEKAVISRRNKEILKKLSRSQRCKIAIISGRALKDIKNKLGIKNIIYAGNHGLEIQGPKIKFSPIVSSKYSTIISDIKNDLTGRLYSIKGILIEDKGLSLSLHYRLVDKKKIPLLKRIFNESVISYKIKRQIRIRSGKMVLEIGPPICWDKGKVALWLLARREFVLKNKMVSPIYIGDDLTDEDAFYALRNRGITIFVGRPKASYAQYYLKDTCEASEFLKKILQIQSKDYLCQN